MEAPYCRRRSGATLHTIVELSRTGRSARRSPGIVPNAYAIGSSTSPARQERPGTAPSGRTSPRCDPLRPRMTLERRPGPDLDNHRVKRADPRGAGLLGVGRGRGRRSSAPSRSPPDPQCAPRHHWPRSRPTWNDEGLAWTCVGVAALLYRRHDATLQPWLTLSRGPTPRTHAARTTPRTPDQRLEHRRRRDRDRADATAAWPSSAPAWTATRWSGWTSSPSSTSTPGARATMPRATCPSRRSVTSNVAPSR